VERLDSFVPVETASLPRPLHRFGTAFPLAIAADGTADALGIDAQLQDLTVSADCKRAGVVLDGKRALVFDLQ